MFCTCGQKVTVRLVLAVAVARGWRIQQIDVNNAFLHGALEEELYLKPPPGYSATSDQVCRLKKSLYGLKQAPRVWYKTLANKVLQFGFEKSPHDHCLFFKYIGAEILVLTVYVDDILLTGSSPKLMDEVKLYLHQAFTIKDFGEANYFLGLEIKLLPDVMILTQRQYIFDILDDMNMLETKSTATPLPTGLKLSAKDGEPLADASRYRRLIGRLLYLNFSRPDVTFATQQLSQFTSEPTITHWRAATHLLRYLKGTMNHSLAFDSTSSLQLEAYCDADWGTCPDSRKSITDYCVFLGSNLISLKAKKQSTVSISSTEAEYRSMSTTTSELLWISYLLNSLKVTVSQPIPLHCDNLSALHIARNPVFHERTKHIEIACHFVTHHVLTGFISLVHSNVQKFALQAVHDHAWFEKRVSRIEE
ncbi:uncharacterized mitochondrial protein AtMg00810-like [Andrographis paniculata]|uniref:uncharacterized mitochondrial protein AtMg00810-like n=1 Tax=Andrographis paniculata TaxID=175694 RepID=UPI0021E85EEA|nr:uncharacterized mitochondrial protein AtMg00810-like [Andrographis paniculata]